MVKVVPLTLAAPDSWTVAGMLAPMPALVRRLAAVVPLLALAGCAGLGQPAAYDQPGINGLVIPTPSPAPDDFVDVVDNPWLALERGTTTHYEVTAAAGTYEVEVLADTTEIAGLAATGVRTVTDIDGAATDETRYYAQDVDGNVWLVGVDAAAPVGGTSWRAGEDGAEAGLAMPALPRLGDGWVTCGVPSVPEASRKVEDLSSEMVQMLDEADTTTRSTYEKGVGLVGVEDLDAGWTAEQASDE